jgi:uncharacterized protein YecT (DUF1311 family)
MSRILFILALGLVCLAAGSSLAVDPKPPTSEDWTEDPVRLYPKAVEALEARLEVVYRAAMADADTQEHKEDAVEQRRTLAESQVAWRAWEKADAAFGAVEAAGSKSVEGINLQVAARHLYQLRLRIYQLGTSPIQGWRDMPAVAEYEPFKNPGPVTDENWERFGERDPKMNYPKVLDFFKAKLERIYQGRRQRLPPESRPAFEAAQAAWRAYHEVDGIYGALTVLGGSGQAGFAMDRHAHQLHLRIYQLGTPFSAGWPAVPDAWLPEDAPKPAVPGARAPAK